MKFEIRKAKSKDFNKVYRLIKEFATFIATPDKVLTTPTQMKHDADYFNCLIAVANEKIIGFATFFTAYYSWSGKTLYLDDLYVQPEFRGLGIGTSLFESIVDMAKSQKCRKLKWQVSNWNQKAIKFYEKKGASVDIIEINCELMICKNNRDKN